MEKQCGWSCKLDGEDSLGISKPGQIELIRLMESQIWQQLASPVAPCQEGLEKGQWPLLASRWDTSASPNMSLVPFKLPPIARAQRKWVWVRESMCGFFKRNCLGLQKFLPPTQSSPGFCCQKLWALIFLPLEPWAGVGPRLLVPEMSLPNLYPPHVGVGPA